MPICMTLMPSANTILTRRSSGSTPEEQAKKILSVAPIVKGQNYHEANSAPLSAQRRHSQESVSAKTHASSAKPSAAASAAPSRAQTPAVDEDRLTEANLRTHDATPVAPVAVEKDLAPGVDRLDLNRQGGVPEEVKPANTANTRAEDELEARLQASGKGGHVAQSGALDDLHKDLREH